MNSLIQIHLEAEDHVIGVDRMTVRKMQATAECETIPESIRRDVPRPGQSQLGLLRKPVDMDQITDHLRNDFPGGDISGGDRVQCFWFGTQRYDQTTTRLSDRVIRDKDFFAWCLRLGRVGRSKCAGESGNNEGAFEATNAHTAHLGTLCASSCTALARSI